MCGWNVSYKTLKQFLQLWLIALAFVWIERVCRRPVPLEVICKENWNLGLELPPPPGKFLLKSLKSMQSEAIFMELKLNFFVHTPAHWSHLSDDQGKAPTLQATDCQPKHQLLCTLPSHCTKIEILVLRCMKWRSHYTEPSADAFQASFPRKLSLPAHPVFFFSKMASIIQWNCYSESGRPRHIFLLLPSSRYSQMTNLPRETKGNNLGTGAVDLHGLQCDGGCVTLGLRAGRECQRHRVHSSQTKMRGGRGGITHRTRMRLSLFFFVTSHHEMCPTGNLMTRWGWGENFCDQEG